MRGVSIPDVALSVRPSTSAASPAVNRTTPRTSTRRTLSSRDSLATVWTSPITSRATGTLRKKIQRQPSVSTMVPPTRGPNASATEAAAAIVPRARPRRFCGKLVVMRAMAAGPMSAAPAPWKALAPMSHESVIDSPHSMDATMKVPTPIRNTRRRPNMSAMRPAAATPAAAASRYAVIVHCAAVLEMSKERSMVGRATATAVSSTNQRDMDRAMPASSKRCCLVVAAPGPSTSPPL